jgi:hypothetical protein
LSASKAKFWTKAGCKEASPTPPKEGLKKLFPSESANQLLALRTQFKLKNLIIN